MPITKYGPFIIACLMLWSIPAQAQYSPQDLLRESNVLFEKGSYAEAMKGYAQLLSLEPSNPEYSFKYGATALYGDPSKREEAIKYLRFASGKSLDDNRVWYFLGRAYHLNYQFADAIAAYQTFAEKASKSEAEKWQISQVIETARNGQNLLNQIKDITVLDKKKATRDDFFRLYDLSDIGGKILVTPEELLSPLDKKLGHRSLIHFRGAGTKVYFSSYGKDGKHGLDIYSAEVLPGGTFSEPRPLSGNVNTPYDEDFPYMHPDGKTFYYSSKGHSSMGGYDVFRSSYDRGSGTFASPQNMDFAINTPDDDIFYIADSLNGLANFASGRSSKQGELHVYRVEVDMSPVELTLVKGSFANRIAPGQRTIKISVTDAATNKRVEVQYSDPATGDYLLSFPKSGKYKIAVEAQNSERVHTGMVDIPKGDGLNAYLQEMELIAPSGLEKLVINNLFDQKYQGDITALMQEMLRQKAELEINFDKREELEEPEIAQVPQSGDFQRAYNDAGFGAGLSNDAVLNSAEERLGTMDENAREIAEKRDKAATIAQQAFLNAQDQLARAEALKMTDPNSDGGKGVFEAAVAQWEARQALDEARVAAELHSTLTVKAESLQSIADKERGNVESLENALQSGDYDLALEALKSENERLKSFDRLSLQLDMNAEVSLVGKDARKEADRFMSRATNMRAETETLISTRTKKQRELEKSKGKAAADLELEVSRLSEEITEMQSATTKAYDLAYEKEAAAQRVADQVSLLQSLDESKEVAKPLTVATEAPSGEELEKLRNVISALSIDKQAAEAYLLKHPEALAALGDGNELRAFRRLTGVGDLSMEEALAISEPAATGQTKTVVRSDRTEPAVDNKGQEVDQNGAGDEQKGQGSAKEDIGETTIEVDANELAIIEEDRKAEAGGVEVAIDQEPVVKNFQPDGRPNELPEEAVSTQSSTKADSPEAGVESALATEANEDRNSDTAAGGEVDLNETITAEQVKIDAAKDWVVIIEESISELQEAALVDEQAAEQLVEYNRLREEKIDEIAQSEALVQALREGSQSSASSADIATEARNIAFEDLESIDIAYLSRLESKINEASSTASFVNDIEKISDVYIPDLTRAELSGKSAPEIAADRIKINESLIVALNAQIEGDAPSGLKEERLIELRRIKALEIQEDLEVMEGRTAYLPRTSDAIAYGQMLSDAGSETDSPKSSPEAVAEQAAAISPAIMEAIQKPYSWDDVVPGYAKIMDAPVDATTPAEELERRVDAHKTMLSRLKDDIDMFALLSNSEAGEADPRITLRYEQLLSERSQIAEVLEEEQLLLQTSAIQVIEEGIIDIDADDIETVNSDQSESIVQTDALAELDESITIPTVKAGEIDAFIDRINRDLAKEMADFASKELPASDKLAQMAVVNRSAANDINTKIDELALALDASLDDAERDLIQIHIQKLDALVADRLQEADRFEAEAESALIMAMVPTTDTEASDKQLVSEDLATNEIPAALIELEELRIAEANPVDVEDFNFRSLQANINAEKLNEAAQLARQKRLEATQLMEAYRSATSTDERQLIYADIEGVANEVKRADLAFNKAVKSANISEIAYFENSSVALHNDIVGNASANEAQGEEANSLINEIENLKAEIAKNNEIRDELDAFDTFAYSEMLKQERLLIQEMELAYSGLEAISGALDRPDELTVAVVDADIAEVTSNDELKVAERLIPKTNTEEKQDENLAFIAGKPLVELSPVGEKDEVDSEKIADPLKKVGATDETEDINPTVADLPEDSGLSHEILPNRTYMTPALQRRVAALGAEQRELLGGDEPMLAAALDFAAPKSRDEQLNILILGSKIDSIGLSLLADAPLHLEYLSTSILADSLKKLETAHAEYIEFNYSNARELDVERGRLEIVKASESNELNRQNLDERTARMKVDAEEAYIKAALAASRAELIRIKRQEQEMKLVAASKALEPSQRSALNALLKSKPYTIVPSDLASNDLAKAPESEPAVPAPKAEAKSAIKGSGYWLEMVEIIAEKSDFSDVDETMFVLVDKPLYSPAKPIPVDPEMPDGLFFQVQVGAFRNPIPQDLFGDIAPIIGQKLSNGITRYRAGIFKEYRNAIEARDLIRSKGYKDAFVVAYLGGEALTGVQARDILAQAASQLTAEESVGNSAVQPTPIPVVASQSLPEAVPVPDYYNDPLAAQAMQVEVTKGLFYTVQVGVYSKPVKLEQLYNLSDINSELTQGGLIRYTSGRFSSVEAASRGKQDAIGAGVNDAFVTAYYNGKRISLSEASAVIEREGEQVLSLDQTKKSATPANTGESNAAQTESVSKEAANVLGQSKTYVVILGQFGGEVPQNIANFFLENENLGIRRIQGPSGQSMYVSPEFNSKPDAQKFLDQAKAAGIATSILGEFIDGEIKSAESR